MAYIKPRTLINHCFALNEFIPGICTCFNGSPLIAKELAANTAVSHAGFLRDSRLISVINAALQGRDNPLADFDDRLINAPENRSSFKVVNAIYYLYAASVLIPWYFTKGIYPVSAQKMQQIFTAPADEAHMLRDVQQLPQWAVFVSLPFFEELPSAVKLLYPACLRDFGGFFASLQQSGSGTPELCLLMMEHGGLLMERLKVNLSAADCAEAAAPFLAETARNLAVFAKQDPELFTPEYIERNKQSVLELIPAVLRILQAVCTAAGFTDLKGRAAIPHNPQNAQPAASEQFFCLQ